MDGKKLFEKFKSLANDTGAERIVIEIIGKDKYYEMMDWAEASIIDQLMVLVVLFVVLMVIGIILGSLEGPLTSAIPDTSSFAGLKTSIPQNLNSAMNIAVIIPLIMAAIMIIGVVYMFAGRKQ